MIGAAPRLACILALSATTTGCSSVIGAVRGDDVSAIWRGRALVERRCTACHAATARGQIANPAAPTFLAISARYSDLGLGRELEGISVVGHYEMPALEISPEERKAIIAYVVSLKARDSVR